MARKSIPDLTPAQLVAIDRLARGDGPEGAASAVGASLADVLGWLQTDTRFLATLNARRLATWDAASDRARALVREALDVVGDVLRDSSDRKAQLHAAALVLRAAGLDQLGAPRGTSDPEDIEAERREAALFRSLRG